MNNGDNETRLARLEGEHVSLIKVLFETRDQMAARMDSLTDAIHAQNKMLTAIVEGLQKPGSPMNNGLLEAISRIMTRVRGTEEAYTELRRFVVETHEDVGKVLATSTELAATTQQIIDVLKGDGGRGAE
jgi:hypothetical protein